MESITGIGIYPLTSFVLFFVFFLLVTYFTYTTDKTRITELSNIPLDNNEKKEGI
jgi:cbb3-type cytochrome oxidase subunit 3